jgi:hypothetical protein
MSAASQKSPPPPHDEEGTVGPVPPPLPANPRERAALFAHLEEGIAAALTGDGEDWEEVHARIFGALPV